MKFKLADRTFSRWLFTNGPFGWFATSGGPSTTGLAFKKFRTAQLRGCGPTSRPPGYGPGRFHPKAALAMAA